MTPFLRAVIARREDEQEREVMRAKLRALPKDLDEPPPPPRTQRPARTRHSVLDLFDVLDAVRTEDVMTELGWSRGRAHKALGRLVARKEAERVSNGIYRRAK